VEALRFGLERFTNAVLFFRSQLAITELKHTDLEPADTSNPCEPTL